MSSFSLSGGVQVFGFISPSDTTDQYPVIDPLYGIDGFRNVDTLSDLNNIPTLRRRAGMVVGVSGGTTYYKLNLPPWNNTISDWSNFNAGSSGSTISGDYLPLSGGTVSGGTEFTNGLTANTISASTYLNLPQDIFVTGGTYSGDTITFTNNSGGTFNVTGVTFSGGSSVLGDYLPLSGGTVTGETIFTQGLYSNSENVGLIIDAGNLKRVGFMKYGGLEGSIARVSTQNFRILRTSGIDINDGTNAVTDFYIEGDGKIGIGTTTPITNLDVSGNTRIEGSFTANTISASTYLNLPQDIFVTGGTFDKNTETLTLTDITGGTITITGFTDTFVTGGTYSAGTTTFTNNSGGTFNVSGFYTGETSYVNSLTTGVGLSGDTTTGAITIINTDPDQVVTISGGTGITTGGTYPNFTITNSLPDQTVVLNSGTNIDVNGTYPNFTINVTGLTDNDTYVTGFTYSANTFTIYQNSGSSLTSTINNVTGLTINGNLTVTGNTNISGATNISGDLYAKTLVSTLSIGDEGGEIGLAIPQTNTTLSGDSVIFDVYQNKLRFFEGGGSNRGAYIDLSAAVAGVGSNLLSGSGEVNTASNLGTGFGLFAQKLGVDLQFRSLTSTGNTITISSGSTMVNLESMFLGGTVTGATNFNGGLSANTISATTYTNLPTDVRVTGATYSNNTFTYTNNTGGTFNVNFNTLTGATINGNLNVTGTTSSGTISATTYQNLPTDIRVTGGTYTAGTATFTNNTGGTFSVSGFTTGGTSSSYWQYRKTFNAFHSNAGLSGAAYALAISANVLFAFPIDVKRDVTISSLVIGNVGASAGNSVWGVYDSLNGEPNNLICQTTAFNNAVAGAVSYSISPSQTLTTGIYWVVYHSSSTPTLRVMQLANSVPNIIGENGSLFNGSMTYLFRNLAYSGTLPSPFGAASLPTTISLIPFVQFGVTY